MGNRYADNTCPKCGGKIMIDKDMHGWYEQCLQCSYMKDLVAVHPAVKKPGAEDLVIDDLVLPAVKN